MYLYLVGGVVVAGLIYFLKDGNDMDINTYDKSVQGGVIDSKSTPFTWDGSRGIRNNNPGNIRKTSDKWQGLADSQGDDEFFQFVTAEYGIRAIVRILNKYYYSYGLTTIDSMLNRYAPKAGNSVKGEYVNPTNNYVAFVSKKSGIGANTTFRFNQDNLFKIVKGIIEFENGTNPYPDSIIRNGVARGFV